MEKTKAMFFTELKDIVVAATEITEDARTEYIEFIDKQLESLEKRKEKAAERAAQKKEASDALTEAIAEVLTDEFKTLDQIIEAFEDNEEVTRNKITARLGKLVKAGVAEKDTVKVDGNKRMAYRRVG